MNKVSQTGTFKCTPTDWGVSVTDKSGIPQFVFQANLIAIYDFETKGWQDYSDFEEGTVAFLCLFNKGGEPIRNMEQVMTVFGWDGQDFAVLANGDYSELELQIRIEDNDPEYADNNPFQVAWIDVADAVPAGSIRKLDDNALAALNAKFAVKLKKNAKVVAQTAAKPASPKDKTPPPAPASSAEEKMRRNRAQTAKDEKAKVAKAGKSAMPTMPKKEKGETKAGMTQEEAWDVICATQKELKCDDDKVNDALFDAIAEVGGDDCDVDTMTGEQWAEVAGEAKKILVGA